MNIKNIILDLSLTLEGHDLLRALNQNVELSHSFVNMYGSISSDAVRTFKNDLNDINHHYLIEEQKLLHNIQLLNSSLFRIKITSKYVLFNVLLEELENMNEIMFQKYLNNFEFEQNIMKNSSDKL